MFSKRTTVIALSSAGIAIIALVLYWVGAGGGSSRGVALSPTAAITAGVTDAAHQEILFKSIESENPCSGALSSDFSCYELLYISLVTEKGVDGAFEDLKARHETNDFVQTQCHPLAHVIGRVAVQTYPEVSEAYAVGDPFCWSGYYHGVLETVMSRVGIKNISGTINTLCKKLDDGKYSFDYYNCVHGVGHGLMAITDNQLFRSLDYCDGLTGEWERLSCASGVYMENVIADGLNHVTGYLDPRRPHFPCDQSPDKYKGTCYSMQTSYMLKINKEDFAKTFEWCREAGEHKAACIQSLGRDASARSYQDASKARDFCSLGSDVSEVGNCAVGAAKDFVSNFHSDKQALALCDAFESAEIQSLCRNVTRDYYKTF